MFDKSYNLESVLLKKEKINKNFIEKIKFLTLEELISLKLISSSKDLKGKIYNFPFYKYASDIAKQACLEFALTISESKREASMILGIPKVELNRLIKLYELTFENNPRKMEDV